MVGRITHYKYVAHEDIQLKQYHFGFQSYNTIYGAWSLVLTAGGHWGSNTDVEW